MAAELKPYRAYKNSGVNWLGAVPVHWHVARLKCSLANIVEQEADFPRANTVVALENVESWTGRVAPSDSGVSFESQLKRFQPGDVLFGKLRPYLAKVVQLPRGGLCVGEFLVLRPRHGKAMGSYFEHLLRSKPIIDAVTASTFGAKMPRADWGFVGGMLVVLPPIAEQAAIVRFLDHVDRRIRRYIRAKQKLIALLEEKKQAIIHQAVTGQIDVRTGRPHPAYKPSGSEWLGDVPADWNVERVKHVTRVLRGKFTHRPRNDPSLYGGPYPFIQTGDVTRAEKKISGYQQSLNDDGFAVSEMFPAGTVVMAIAANVGDVAILSFDACFPDSVVGFLPRNDVERDFMYYAFRTIKRELLREAPVNTQGNLNVDRIGSRRIPIPPVGEQGLIVRQIEATTAGLTAAANRANREVELLREYRTRVIADVVTGKLDVRDAAAPLPGVDPFGADEMLRRGDEADEVRDSQREAFAAQRDEFGTLARDAGGRAEFPETDA